MTMLSANTDDDQSGDQTVSVVEAAWARLSTRIENGLGQLELIVSHLFERPLLGAEIDNGRELAGRVASDYAVLGLPTTAGLIRQAAEVFESQTLGVQDAVMMSLLLEDARVAAARTVSEILASGFSATPIVIVGEDSELVDNLIWVTFAQGLAVSRHEHSLASASPVASTVGGVFLVADQVDASRSRSVARSIREMYPVVPIVAIMGSMEAQKVAALAPSVNLVLPSSIHPVDMVAELQKARVRAAYEPAIALVGEDADKLATALAARGFIVDSTRDADELVDAVAQGICRGVIIGGNSGTISDLEILRVLQTDRRTRSTVAVMVSRDQSVARAHHAMRSGADLVVPADVDIDDLTVSLRSLLARRADREPVADQSSKIGLVPWRSASVMMERMMMVSFRRHQTVGVGVVELPPTTVDGEQVDDMIASEFRNEDVITRLDENLLVIALQGVNEKIMMRRMQDIHQRHDLVEHGGRIAVLEFPSDGRSLDDLLTTAQTLLANAAEGRGPTVVGSAWRVDAGLAPDILMVDPDETLGAVLAATMQRRGVKVELQPDAVFALDHLTGAAGKPYPKLVILELDLLGIDGLEFMRKLRDAGTIDRFKIVVLSARSREGDLQQAFELGADDYVGKPFSAPLLLHRLARLLEST